MSKLQRGFTVIETLIGLVVITGVAFGGYSVWHHNKTSNANAVATTSTTPNKTTTKTTPILGKTYSNKDGQFSLQYPSSWRVITTNDGTEAISSPSGSLIVFSVFTNGGRGACEGGGCDTLTYKSVMDTGQKALRVADNGRGLTYTKVPLNLVKLTEADSKGKVRYFIGLSDDTKANSNIDKPQADIGSEDFFNFYFTRNNDNKSSYPLIAMYAASTKSNFFTSDDGQTIQAILKSFQYTQ